MPNASSRRSASIGLLTSAVLATGAFFANGQEAAPASTPIDYALKLSLDDAVGLLLRNNLSLRSALVDEQIEEARVREALGAFDPTLFAEFNTGKRERLTPSLFPDALNPNVFQTRIVTSKEDNLDATLGVRGRLVSGATYDASIFNFYQFDRAGSPFNPVWSTTAQLRLTQPLLRAAWNSYGESEARAARNRVAQARETFRGTTAERVRAVQVAYFDLVSANENVATKRRSLEVAEELVAINRVKVDAGAFPPVEMTSAEAGRAARRSDLVTAEAALTDSEDRLRREIFSFDTAAEWTVRIVPVEPLESPSLSFIAAEHVTRLARTAEPRLLKARLVSAQAEDDLESRRSDRRPKLDAVGSTSVTGIDQDGLQPYASLFDRSEGSLTWAIGLAFEMPIGNRSASAREAAAELQLTKARIEVRNLEVEVDFGVRKTLRDLEVAERSIRARAEALRFAEQEVENERVKLEAQTSTNFQVFEAEDRRNQRRTEWVQALVSRRLSELDLERTTGVPIAELIARP